MSKESFLSLDTFLRGHASRQEQKTAVRKEPSRCVAILWLCGYPAIRKSNVIVACSILQMVSEWIDIAFNQQLC